MRDSSLCPDPEMLSAFVAGTLSADELKQVTEHLLTCEDCRFIVREAAHTDREHGERKAAAMIRPRRPAPWWFAAAAAALVGIISISVWRTSLTRNREIATLVEATPRDERYLEPRLTGGFPWAPLRSMPRGDVAAHDPEQMKLIGVAGAVLERSAGNPSPQSQHAAAIAHLVAGHTRDAVRVLFAAVRSKPDAKKWSDLSAAYYMLAVQTNNAAQLARALEAADAALRLEPALPEALFNRALAVERLGARQQARAAWERYLSIDPGSPWTREARQHLDALAAGRDFRSELMRQYDSLEADPRLARTLAARFPHDARVWGETAILGNWADAEKRNDRAAGERHLRIARAFGDELAASRGESMLQAATRAVEHATAADRTLLADAHLRFRTAQEIFKLQRPAEAEPLFAEAADGFQRAGSPLALLARYFVANTLYEQGKIDEARGQLEALLAAAPPPFPAYRAQIEWELGLAYGARGRWGDAMRALKSSIATFERLHESAYATWVREILAQVYDQIGDSHSAWQHRITALQELGRSENLRLAAAMFAAARAAAVNRQWGVSVALLGMQLEMARSDGDELLYIETLLLRARLHARLDQAEAGRADLSKARSAIAKLRDRAHRERMQMEYSSVDARLIASARDAVPRLSEVIEFHRVKGRRMFLPELYLQRGRALAALRRAAEAAADFEAGIAELELQRAALPAGEIRWGMFTAADELVEEAIASALTRRDPAAAYSYSERARARELLESLVPAAGVLPGKAHEITIVEYASLPKSLVIFVVGDGPVRVVQEQVDRASLELDVDQLAYGAEFGNAAEFRRVSTRLYSLLIEPVAGMILPGTQLVFVPDATLRDVSFAALASPSGRYLVEDHAVVVSPSAAVYRVLASRSPFPKGDVRLLFASGAHSRAGDIGYLSAAEREEHAVEREYRDVVKISPAPGDRNAFRTGAADADIIHFVGHATSDETSGAALLASSNDEGDARLDVHDIAASHLTRTRVVVLAACSTAEGEERGPEGRISVARAFLAAGVPSVVATLWPIDDRASADFFPLVHHYLARGAPAAEALRLAQLESIRKGDVPPSMWAAVQIIGS
jgi:CHAT domain-containing protein/tetratricopeptide (TPR) repeat protein